ncbi:hypothetical protein PR202_ga11214 [Eleusine coracana subsp. coracana]|uniref:Uncharacterized protein n=1 Tax=Eleusine coracana subsp. coracana TaxID=191504 RepID=A0AAV5C8J6_ELECO|nr:hypothetical protein PR202_ga11214 [Eleusine coracana subsp. coracana]
MFRSSAKVGTNTSSSELPVEGMVRVRRVERIEAYNVATMPPATATAKMARSLTVQVVRVGDVDENTYGFVSVPITHN